MKIWISKNSEISVREQLLTQITLAILSGDLRTGERLPSTREIARRFNIHSNTVGFVYQKLAEQDFLRFKKGSGFFVSPLQTEDANGEIKLNKLIDEFFQAAQDLGFSPEDVQKRLQKHFVTNLTEYVIVVESDTNLREIIIEEISAKAGLPVFGISFEDFKPEKMRKNFVVAALLDEKTKLEAVLSGDVSCVFLKARSVSDSMTGVERPAPEDLIAVVSGWEKFLVLAKTILVAAKINPECLIIRSTTENDWRKGLSSASLIICDALTAKFFDEDKNLRVFRLIADDSLAELDSKIKSKKENARKDGRLKII
jgi:GntR family transcriptional regulator